MVATGTYTENLSITLTVTLEGEYEPLIAGGVFTDGLRAFLANEMHFDSSS